MTMYRERKGFSSMSIALRGHGLSTSYSPDGRYLAILGGNQSYWEPSSGFIDVYDASSLSRLYTRDIAFGGTCLAWSPDSSRLAYGGHAGVITIWDLATEQDLLTYTGHSPEVGRLPNACGPTRREIYATAWLPDEQVISFGRDSVLRRWDARTGTLLHARFDPGFSSRLIITSNGSALASSAPHSFEPDRYQERAVRLYESEQMQLLSTLPNTGESFSMGWSSNGKLLALGSWDYLQLWDTSVLMTPELLWSLNYHPFVAEWSTEPALSAVTWSPDGAYVAYCATWHWSYHMGQLRRQDTRCNAAIEIRETVNGAVVQTIPVKDPCALHWSPDGVHIVVLENVEFQVVTVTLPTSSSHETLNSPSD